MSYQDIIAEFIGPGDRRWRDVLEDVHHDIYHLPEYLEFAARHEGGEPVAFYVENSQGKTLIPLLQRAIPRQLAAPNNWCDLTSPYGYASPLTTSIDNMGALKVSLSALKEFSAKNGIVSAFIRFNPLLRPHPDGMTGLDNIGELVNHGQTVFINLRLSNDEIWRQTRKNHRSGIRKLFREGYIVKINCFDYLLEFAEIYRNTMSRVGARGFYYFTDDYFKDLLSALEGKMNLVCVISPSGDLASGGLFSIYQDIVEFHLAGTNEKYIQAAPTKIMFDFVRRWGKENNCKCFHLGGGVGASADQLLHFKAGFSDLRSDFYTLRVVLDTKKYNQLNETINSFSESVKAENSDDYFPLYRKTLH